MKVDKRGHEYDQNTLYTATLTEYVKLGEGVWDKVGDGKNDGSMLHGCANLPKRSPFMSITNMHQ